jgi:hypothetical protein
MPAVTLLSRVGILNWVAYFTHSELHPLPDTLKSIHVKAASYGQSAASKQRLLPQFYFSVFTLFLLLTPCLIFTLKLILIRA